MKASSAFIFLALFTAMASMYTIGYADETAETIAITYPSNGAVFGIPVNNTTMVVGIYCTVTGMQSPHQYGWGIHIDNTWLPNPGPPFFDPFIPVTESFNFTVTVGVGSHSLRVLLYKWDPYQGFWLAASYDDVSFSCVQPFEVTFKNDFPLQPNGTNGEIKVGDWNPRPSHTSPYVEALAVNSTRVMEAVDQDYQAPNEPNYFRVFNGWSKGEGSFSSERTKETDPVSATTTYKANFLKQFDITFQNSFVGVGNAGAMTINDTVYNLPHASFPVLQYNSITASAGSQGYNGIEYIFDHWSDSYPYSSRTITPTDHATYTAFYVGRPLQMWHYGLHGNSTVGEPVTLYWDVHLNPNVTEYQIWRKVRHNGVTGSPSLLATLDRNTTTYIDWNYIISANWDLVSYDVRPYYSVEQTYADPWWESFFAEGGYWKQSACLIPTTFSLENYPNPFNPSTQIKFGLPEDANVSLIVYDVLGKKVVELANGYHEAGYYSAVWNATGESGASVSSGVYFARFVATNPSGKVVYSKITKLLLMK